MTTLNPVLAVGDVHGQIDKLKEVIEPHKGSNCEIIFLGDLIDRATEPNGDLQVLEYVKDLQDNAESYGLSGVEVCLGNHEQYLLNLKTKFKESSYDLWIHNGGDPEFYAKADPYLPWISTFDTYLVRGDYLFVHAGVKPNVRLKKQKLHDLLWIREEFLDCEDHGMRFTIVHGHSVVGISDLNPNPSKRIPLDFGACFGGPLVSALINPSTNQYEYLDRGVPVDDLLGFVHQIV